jgi:hypothetical protein
VSDLLWVKMPSKWISDGSMAKNFSVEKNISTDIASLKIYMYLCLFAQPIKHSKITKVPGYLSPDGEDKVQKIEEVVLTSECTYDQISDGCGLSRLLVSRGLKKLISTGLILNSGGTRKKIYQIKGEVNRNWCKLPKRKLVALDRKIGPFRALKNRYQHELEALKLFLYLISIRPNSEKYTDVSKEKIIVATSIDLYDIDSAVKLLLGIGMLENVKSRGYTKGFDSSHAEKYKLARYFVISSGMLALPRYKV